MGSENYGDLLLEIMGKYTNIVALDADLVSAAGARKAWKTFPKRFFNVGIAESNMMGVAAGLSMTGYIPYVHSFAAFATRRAYDQIYLSCAYAKNNVKIFASDGGFNIGINGGTHTSYEDMGMMRLLPDLIVSEPCDTTQMRWAMNEIYSQYGVHYTRVFRRPVRDIYKSGSNFMFGKGNVIKNGNDATIIACGSMVYEAILASDYLAEKGIQVCVIDMFTLKPIDSELINEIASRCKIIITAENHNVIGGLGSAVAEVLAESGFGTILRRVGNKDRFGQVGSVEFLQKEYAMMSEDIVKLIQSLINK
jgi:transketolase